MVIRKDVFILIKKMFFSAVLIILPFLVFNALIMSFPSLLDSELGYPLIVLFSSFYFLFFWLFSFFSFIDYYLDIWIISNKRIIDVDQRGFFSRVISEQKIVNMQDVTSESHGVFPTIFKFGEVHVQTAGAKSRFIFEEVPNPDKIRDMIIKLADDERCKTAKTEGVNG